MIFNLYNGNKVEISKYLRDYFSSKEEKPYNNIYELWMGCDSAYRRNGVSEYSTVVCIRIEGQGVHILHKKNKIEGKIKPNPKLVDFVAKKNLIFNMVLERLWQEVVEVKQLILYLKQKNILFYKTPDDSYMSAFTPLIKNIVVHIDFNGYEEHLSNNLTTAGISYINALGIKAEKKPEAFAATYAAHNYL